MKEFISLFILFFPSLIFAQNPKAVTLKQWMGVIGNMSNQSLGGDVLGIKPSADLPYRAAVSRSGFTDFFRLQSPTDTVAGLTLRGIHPLVGDFNADGFQDVVILRQSSGYGIVDTVFVYWGTAIGIDTLNPLKIPGENYLDGIQPGCVGDINNDGKTDLILTASRYPGGKSWGKVYMFLNPISKATADHTVVGDSVTAPSGHGENLGVNCAVADLNNDGYQDLIVRGAWGANDQDTVKYDYLNIYWGTGRNSLPELSHPTQIQIHIPYPYMNDNYGLACYDANGDGIPDLVCATDDSAGRWISIYCGGKNFSTSPNFRIKSPGAPTFGRVIANAGDMNGKGYNDLAVGCPEATYTAGFIFVYSGGPKMDSTFDAAVGVQGLYEASSFGESVSSVGDLNGDGLSDIIVGATLYPSFEFHDTQGFFGIFLGDSAIPTSARQHRQGLPNNLELYQAYPNPFNPTTTISYDLPAVSFVTLKIFDVVGREVRTLVQEVEKPGMYQVKFDGTELASGVYFYRLAARTRDGTTFIQIKKATLIK